MKQSDVKLEEKLTIMNECMKLYAVCHDEEQVYQFLSEVMDEKSATEMVMLMHHNFSVLDNIFLVQKNVPSNERKLPTTTEFKRLMSGSYGNIYRILSKKQARVLTYVLKCRTKKEIYTVMKKKFGIAQEEVAPYLNEIKDALVSMKKQEKPVQKKLG